MIPKIIHYCWFGKNELPEMANMCIESWKKCFPDYEIKQWDETNFDIEICDFTKEAYKAKKYAFVSDYARFYILYKFGGIYFDTDVEVIRSIGDILEKGPFMGCEKAKPRDRKKIESVAPGLGIAAEPGMYIYKKILEMYEKMDFASWNNTGKRITVVDAVTSLLKEEGFQGGKEIENVAGINIYSSEYFCPMNYYTGEVTITDKTRSIHHYADSWHSETQRRILKLEQKYGKKSLSGMIIITPLRIKNKLETEGVSGIVRVIKKRLHLR